MKIWQRTPADSLEFFSPNSFVFAAVLLAAACHAGWNATIKGGLDPLATTVLISIGAAIVAAVFLPLVGLPARAAWPLCVASVLIHLVPCHARLRVRPRWRLQPLDDQFQPVED